ncbi:patatin-like phospholipase family protein [uncultured Clostridium sp.]|uniref:patatin-like phospholipase family protein n=1 Tax=uncultured Clostridium sp. TaxID=59620 RepID=UPI0028E73424|nr:patatin-like phospholipase family protein [uncultured Clostridium sp.]
MNKRKRLADAVFEGGGVKGIAFCGAIKVMEDNGYNWRNIAGTSAGAIIAALLSVGYKAEEIKALMEELDYRKIMDRRLGSIMNLVFYKGLYKGDYIREWLEEKFYAKMKNKLGERKSVKFKDLVIDGEEGILLNNPKYKRKYKLHIIATDVTRGRILILPEDIEYYGIEPDELDVSLAVRMSISIPIYFEPVVLKDYREKYYIVDGGVMSNFPVWLFDTEGEPEWPTIGFRLLDFEKAGKNHKITNIFNYFTALVETILKNDINLETTKMDNLRIIDINTLGVKATDFKISEEKIQELYYSGENCAMEFLDGWEHNYAAYVQLRKRLKLTQI